MSRKVLVLTSSPGQRVRGVELAQPWVFGQKRLRTYVAASRAGFTLCPDPSSCTNKVLLGTNTCSSVKRSPRTFLLSILHRANLETRRTDLESRRREWQRRIAS
jgi:hypothetical protein